MTTWLTAVDVGRELNFTPKTIREWCAKGIFPGAAKWPNDQPRAKWRIPREDVEALKRERMEGTTSVPNSRLDELMDAALARAS